MAPRVVALAAAAAALVASATPAPPPTYRVEGSLTRAGFAVTQLGFLTQTGTFERVWGKIVFDPVARTGSVDFILDGTSVSTGWDLRDDFIRGEKMFDVAHHPSLRFRSVRLAWDASALRAVEGEFTLRGVTRPVRLDVRELRCAPAWERERCHAEVGGRISRAAFGMEYGYPLIGDDVDFDFAVTAVRVRDDGETETP
jgi:polyisoprenoid-binding protein YceI